MGHLTGHLAPRLVSFRLSKLLGRVREISYHSVVSLHKRRYLVIPLVDDIFQIVDIGDIHLLTHLQKWREH